MLRNRLRVISPFAEHCDRRRAVAMSMPWADLGATAWMFLLADMSVAWRAVTLRDSVMATRPKGTGNGKKEVYRSKWHVGAKVVVYRSIYGASAAGWTYIDNRPKWLPRDFIWLCCGTAKINHAIALTDVNMAHPHALLVDKVTRADVYEWGERT
jgi:hypothetical protein